MKTPSNEAELDDLLSTPTEGLLDAARDIEGDLIVLGAAGKMGPTLALMARRALAKTQRVIAVSRFSNPAARELLNRQGIETIASDLLNREQVATLPRVENVVFMAGHKFGTGSRPELTWMMNGIVPANVGEHFRGAKTVAFSTGCVYPLVASETGGSQETDPLGPPGEYANSCVARERVFSYYAQEASTPTLLYRLNYAVDLRYGVLHDIATKVWSNQPIDVSMGFVNLIWQADANARALQCLTRTETPTAILNVTGRETVAVRELATRFGEIFGKQPEFIGTEAETAWLSNASKSFDWFGDVTVILDEMIHATAAWIQQGGSSLGKPTHFETRDGKF